MMYNKKIKYRKESINKKLINISIRLIIRDWIKKVLENEIELKTAISPTVKVRNLMWKNNPQDE